MQGSSIPCERAFSDAGLTNTKHQARILPENFGSIQTVKGRYKRERRSCKILEEVQCAAQKLCWDKDSLEQATNLKALLIAWMFFIIFYFFCLYYIMGL